MSSRWPLGLVAAVSASAVCFVILKLGCKRLSSSAGRGGEIAFRWPERHCDWPSRPRGGCRTTPSCLWLFISPHEREHYLEEGVSTRVSTIYLFDFSNQLNSDLCVMQEYRVKGNGVVSQHPGQCEEGDMLRLWKMGWISISSHTVTSVLSSRPVRGVESHCSWKHVCERLEWFEKHCSLWFRDCNAFFHLIREPIFYTSPLSLISYVWWVIELLDDYYVSVYVSRVVSGECRCYFCVLSLCSAHIVCFS